MRIIATHDKAPPTGLVRSRKIDFAHLFEVLAFATSEKRETFGAFGVQVLFELYRWMVTSARVVKARYKGAERRPVYPGIMHVLGGANRLNDSAADALGPDWRAVLRGRLMRALRHGGEVARWRGDQKINPAGTKSIPLLHYKDPPRLDEGARAWGEEGVAAALDALFAVGDGRYHLKPSKTNKRSGARRVTGVQLHVAEIGWRVVIKYSSPESSWTHPGEVQLYDEPFFDFIIRARVKLEKMLEGPCAFRKPPRPRRPACSSGWTGVDPKLGEFIGGKSVRARARKLDLASEGFSPALFGGENPVVITFGRERWEKPTDPERYRLPMDPHYHHRRELSEEQVREGRARYLLAKRAYELGFLDLLPEELSLAASQFLEDGLGSPGGGPRERRGAAAFIKTHPTVAWHEEFDMRCHGKRCDSGRDADD